jgi:hypothetical protein
MSAKIQIVDRQTQSIIFESEMDQYEHALKTFQYYDQELGLDVELKAPSINQSLALELGMTEDQINELELILNEELKGHDSDSCCYDKEENHN